MIRTRTTGWEPAAKWYGGYMGSEGGAFQREIVFPGAMKLLDPQTDGTYLDIACGQGAFAHLLAKKAGRVVGFDASTSLVKQAKERAQKNEMFLVGDAMHFADLFEPASFDGSVCLLAIQNIKIIEPVLHDAALVLRRNSPLVIVMNHPCFRQPSQSGWGWDEQRKLQYRRVDRYLTSYHAPILTHPGADRTMKTDSFHRPLTEYVSALTKNGFVIDALEEWISNKKSDSGPRAKAENAAREEIPMFLALRAWKI